MMKSSFLGSGSSENSGVFGKISSGITFVLVHSHCKQEKIFPIVKSSHLKHKTFAENDVTICFFEKQTRALELLFSFFGA